MVCLGNICRSPMAEGILREKSKEKKLDIYVDSAGFEAYHSGDMPDSRAIAVAKKHGVDISSIRSRLFRYADFEEFDYIYVMDKYNYSDVISMAQTQEDKQKVNLILNAVYPNENRVVPDPYTGGISGFENVFNLLDAACEEICNQLINNYRR